MAADSAPRPEHRPGLGRSPVEALPFGLPFLSRRSRLSRGALVAALFLGLAVVDIATSPDLSFLVFYLLPVLLASWLLGRRQGLLVSFASVAVWTLDDVLTRVLPGESWVPAWNRAGQLAFFVFLAWLAGTLRKALEKEVRERTEHPEKDLGRLDAGRLYVAVADVPGKGMAAALLMSSFLASLRLLLPPRSGRLDLLAGQLSERLLASFGAPRFVTAFVGVIEGGWLRYVNAGHTPGFVLGPAGQAAPLGSTGTVVEGLLAAASAHSAGEPFGDDITILCVRRDEGGGA